MESQSKIIWQALDSDIFARVGLEKGYVNVRGLARRLKEQLKLDLSLGGIITAVQRYAKEARQRPVSVPADRFRGIRVNTRSQIGAITVRKSEATLALIPRVFEVVHWSRGEAVRIATADETIRVLMDSSRLDSVRAIFPKEVVLDVQSEMAEIDVRLSREAYETPGVLLTLLGPLHALGINVLAGVGATEEFALFVDRAQLPQAHDALMRLSST